MRIVIYLVLGLEVIATGILARRWMMKDTSGEAVFTFCSAILIPVTWHIGKVILMFAGVRVIRLGRWYALYQPKDECTEWIEEEVDVFRTWGVLRARTLGNTKDHNWNATLTSLEGQMITGKWRSRNQGAYASGILMLIVSPQGNYMYGHYIGPNDQGKQTLHPYVCACDRSHLQQALQELHASRATLPRGGAIELIRKKHACIGSAIGLPPSVP
jgi:hypothetical protein